MATLSRFRLPKFGRDELCGTQVRVRQMRPVQRRGNHRDADWSDIQGVRTRKVEELRMHGETGSCLEKTQQRTLNSHNRRSQRSEDKPFRKRPRTSCKNWNSCCSLSRWFMA